MSNVQNLLDNQSRIEESLALRMADFEKAFKAASSSNSELTIDKLAEDYKNFKDSVMSILQLLRSQIQAVALQTDELETYNRRNALMFKGIEESDNEDCKKLITEVIKSTMNFTDIEASSIYSCYRLGSKANSICRPILVRFADVTIRNTIWKEKRRLKSTSKVLSEYLTRSRQIIFSSARSHFGIHSCWTRDGAVFIKLPNNDFKRIVTMESLELLMSSHPSETKKPIKTAKVRLRTERTASPPTAAAHQPPQTRKATSNKPKVHAK